jgi:hypothetical protein
VVRVRRQDWPLRLNAWLENIRERPFAWGVNDCALGAADAVFAMTGVDYAVEFRQAYFSKRNAVQLLAARGGLEVLVTQALGEPLDGPRLAQRGDLVLVDTESEGPALAVVIGAAAVAPGPGGATFVPMPQWRKAWRV